MYELMYDVGGRSGPYPGIDEAVEAAKRLLRGSLIMMSIYVVPRDYRVLDIKNAVTVVRRGDI